FGLGAGLCQRALRRRRIGLGTGAGEEAGGGQDRIAPAGEIQAAIEVPSRLREIEEVAEDRMDPGLGLLIAHLLGRRQGLTELGGGPGAAGVPGRAVELVEEQEAEAELGSRFEVAAAVRPRQELEPAIIALGPVAAP